LEFNALQVPESKIGIIGGFKGGDKRGPPPLPNLASHKFQERPSGVYRIQENLLLAL